MHLYRLCKEIYSKNVLDGQGGLSAAGRWHSQGHRVVYCASSEALAVLELRVHLGSYVPRSRYVMHTIDVPDEVIAELPAEAVPLGWDAVPHTETSRAVGDKWLESPRSAALRVPSIHSETDRNVLLNPVHSDFGRVRLLAHRRYRFDRRLFGASEPAALLARRQE